MAFSILNRENQQVFIGSGQAFGVQSVEGSHELPEAPLEFVGLSDVIPYPSREAQGSMNFSALAVASDPFIKTIKSGAINAYILKERANSTDNYSFYSGYLTSYSNTCAIGEIPQLSASYKVVGDMGRIETGDFPDHAVTELDHIRDTDKESVDFNVTAATTAEITLDDFTTNLVEDYSVNINIPRKDYYIIGKRTPQSVEIDYPVTVTASFTITVNDYSGMTMQGYPCKTKLKNFDIKLKNYKNHSLLTEFAFSNATLISESYSVTAEDQVRISATYRSYISSLSTSGEYLNTPELVAITN
jgi:hypothetical protein|tara:strand:- start:8066 stop:8971 length:906 start_codon:yes stop_codon:yes gene_type:complete